MELHAEYRFLKMPESGDCLIVEVKMSHFRAGSLKALAIDTKTMILTTLTNYG